MSDLICAVCGEPIEGDDVENRHTMPNDGEDCHQKCCPVCNLVEGYEWAHLMYSDDVEEPC